MIRNIWLIGGTTESVEIAELLSESNFTCLVSVTTNSATQLYSHISGLKLIVGKIKAEEINTFLAENNIELVIDATHPYAVIISQNAIATCKRKNITYIRYERPLLPINSHLVKEFDSIEALLKSSFLENKKVLLTLGYKSLSLFQNYHQQADLFARVLPYSQSVEMATLAGFKSDRIIAIRPPLSIEFEKALWRLWEIEVVVTKASGKSGGEDIKKKVAKELNITLVTISRPQIRYPQVTSDLKELMKIVSPTSCMNNSYTL